MKTITTNYSKMDDLVFENRNISYGAYALRQKYEHHLLKGLVFTFGIFAIGIGVPELMKNFKSEQPTAIVKETGPIVLDQPPPLTPAVPPPAINLPQPPPPPPSASFIPAVTNEIVPETEIFINKAPTPPPTLNPGDTNGAYGFIDVSIAAPEIGDENKAKESERFYKVEQMPEFKGDLGRFLQNNIRYPEQAEKMGIEGKVYITFIVESDGSIQEIKVLRGIFRDLDEEAVRVVKKMPSWKPGKQSGRAVAVHYTLPITFKLNN